MFAVTQPTIPAKSIDPIVFFRENLQKTIENLLVKLQKIFLQNVFFSFEKLIATCFKNLLVVFLVERKTTNKFFNKKLPINFFFY